jgi:TolB protein
MGAQKLFLAIIILFYSISSSAQDMFPAKQLTSGPEQKGFASWAPDSRAIVHQISTWNDTLGKNGLWIVSAEGKEARRIFVGLAEHPKWSPDGKHIVFDADTGNSIKIIPSSGGNANKFLPDSVLIQNGGLPCWSPDGSSIAFVESKGLSLCTYNFKTGELKSIFQEEGKVPLPGGWWIDGKSILVSNTDLQTRKSTILKVAANGQKIEQIKGHHENFFRHLALSPDGSLLIYAALEGKYLGLYIMPSEGGKSLPLAVTSGHNEGAVWSPDGKKIAFNSTRSGNFDIWIMDVDLEKIWKELQ